MKRKQKNKDLPQASELRIIGGKFRGSKLRYHGDPVTRPMKERVREAIFNLISTDSKGRHAIDLFAGTGALGLEALSRGATSTTFIEKHVPTARVLQENIAALNLQQQSQLLMTSAFLWGKRDLPDYPQTQQKDQPWLVFCSPPYSFYVDRQAEMLELIGSLWEVAPADSIFLVEADVKFDFELLPGGVAETKQQPGWRVRRYPPAVIGIYRKQNPLLSDPEEEEE